MTAVELKKISLPLMALVVPLTAFGGWWATHLETDVRTNRENLARQQLEVTTSISSLNVRQAVMAQDIEHIRQTLERLEKKMERQ